MSRQDGRRLRRLAGRAPTGASARSGRAHRGEKVPEPRAPSLDGTLPSAYGKTRIVLLPVDPYLVHLYWEVSGGGMEFAKALVEAGALLPQAVLRFHDVTAMPAGGMRAEGSFDVEVDIGSRNWYVRLLHPEKAYIVDLGWRGRDGRFHRVARSNRGETPRAWPCAETGQQRMRVVEIDGIIHADPVEEAEFERPSAAVSEVLGHRPRIEMPQEDRLAVVGVGGAPTMTAEAERVRETGSLRRPTPPSSPSPVGPTEEPRSKMEAVYEGRQIVPSEEKWGGGQKPPEGEGRGPAGTDLSFQCDGLFVSGLSSSRITVEGEKDDQDDG